MAVFTLIRRESSKSAPQQSGSSDTLSAPGQLVVATGGADVAAGEKLRVGGDVQIDGLLRGPSTGAGLTIGKAGASGSTGSALTIASFTTTQRGFLTPAVGMVVVNSTLGWFQSYNGTRWGDEARNNNFQATANPVAGNDNTQGYSVGSIWVNTTGASVWFCVSAATGAAVWNAAGASTSVQSTSTTVDFGSLEGDTATATVSAAWVTASTKFQCLVVGGTADHDVEDAAVEEIYATVTNVTAGVSFDVMAYAPQGAWGRYTVNVLGV